MIPEDDVMRLNKDVRYREVGGEGVVLCQDRGEVLVVNGLGVRIVELIEEHNSVETIVRTLLEEYDVGAEQLEEDVVRYLGELREAGVLSASSHR